MATIYYRYFSFLLLLALLTGCASTEVDPTVTSALPTPAQAGLAAPTATLQSGFPLPTQVPTQAANSDTPTKLATATQIPSLGLPLPLTPAQTEGPYYPVEKPADHDNDLTRVEGRSATAAGEVLLLQGRLLDETGAAIAGAVVEIWQTDVNGIYLHPNDPGVANRDANFQSYGEAVTAEDGSYAFRTILPGFYGGRPEHIHVKVRLNGTELLTTQFYFSGDARLESDAIAQQAGSSMVLEPQQGVDELGNPVLVASKELVIAASAVPGR